MKQRIISAIAMIIISVPFIILGGIYFKIFISLLAIMCLFELLKYKKDIPKIIKLFSYVLLVLFLFKKELNISLNQSILIIIFTYLISLIFINNSKKYHYNFAFFLTGVVIFLGISFQSIIDIRIYNLQILLYLIIISVLTDTFALIIGRKWGKHKLAPKISPNKTFEGLIGGCLVGTICSSMFYLFVINSKNILLIFILSLILSIMGQFGDLVKSCIKRTIGIKDFSNLIPGHGGVLDRLDSLIFISITYILISSFI